MAPERMRMISSQAIKPIILVMLALLVLAPISLSFGQSSNSPFHSNPSDAPSPQSSATYAPVGPSGYKVLIPEIKMNRIVGETKPKSPSRVSPEPVVTEPELRPETKSESPRKSQLEPTVEPAPEVHSPPTQDGFIENRTNERPIETPQ
ncbi:MAG: hypothetical protein ACP5VS_08445, partial [Desulfomonilaceae bacterium]